MSAATYAWMDQALCVGSNPEIWFDGYRRAEAQRICAKCPVAEQCREAGADEYRGVWGGQDQHRKTVPASRTAPFLDEHGTNAGYKRHRREGTPPCPRCTIAHQFANREYVAAKPRQRTPEQLAAQKHRRQTQNRRTA